MPTIDGTRIGELKYIVKKSDYIYSNTNRLLNLSERMLDAQGKELVQKLINYTYDNNGNQTSQTTEYITPYTVTQDKSYKVGAYGGSIEDGITTLVEKTINT